MCLDIVSDEIQQIRTSIIKNTECSTISNDFNQNFQICAGQDGEIKEDFENICSVSWVEIRI